jgi:hypothetical protein
MTKHIAKNHNASAPLGSVFRWTAAVMVIAQQIQARANIPPNDEISACDHLNGPKKGSVSPLQ